MTTHLLIWRPTRIPFVALACFLTLSACTEKAAQPKQSDQVTTTPKTTKAKVATPFSDRPYKIKVVPGDAANGKAAVSVIEITPTAGYKMNQDFPSRLRVDASKSIDVPKSDYRGPDVQVSEAKLRFDVSFTPKAQGSLPMSGIADFSVCNENTCKLYRGEKVVWDVAVR